MLSLWLSIVWPMRLTLYRPRHYFWHFPGLLLLPCRLEFLQEGRKKPGTCLQLAARLGQLGSGGSSLQFWSTLAPITPPTSSPYRTHPACSRPTFFCATQYRGPLCFCTPTPYTHNTHTHSEEAVNTIQGFRAALVEKCIRHSVAYSALCGTWHRRSRISCLLFIVIGETLQHTSRSIHLQKQVLYWYQCCRNGPPFALSNSATVRDVVLN